MRSFVFLIGMLVFNLANSVSGKLEWSCENTIDELSFSDKCKLYDVSVVPNKLVYEADKNFVYKSTIKMLSSKVSEIRSSCGTNCTVSRFYNFNIHKLSKAFEDVLAINENSDEVVVIDLQGVKLMSIFSNEGQERVLLSDKELSHFSAIPRDAIDKVIFSEKSVKIFYENKNEILCEKEIKL